MSFESKYLCDLLLVINSNLGPILHRLATIHPWQTDDDKHANSSTAMYGRLWNFM